VPTCRPRAKTRCSSRTVCGIITEEPVPHAVRLLQQEKASTNVTSLIQDLNNIEVNGVIFIE